MTCPRTHGRCEAEPDSTPAAFTWSPRSWELSHGPTLNPQASSFVSVMGPVPSWLGGVAPGSALGGEQLEAGSTHIG